MYTKILVPLDRSELAEAALRELEKFVDAAGVEVTLLTVAPHGRETSQPRRGPKTPIVWGTSLTPHASFGTSVLEPAPPRIVETADEVDVRIEKDMVEYLRAAGSSIWTKVSRLDFAVHFGEPADAIINVARDGGYDLVIMATHARSAFGELMHQSVAEAVVRSGVAPVLLVHQKPD